MLPFVVYLTIYSGDKLPPYYIGSTSLSKLENGYFGSISSKKWKNVYREELQVNRKLFSTAILSEHSTRQGALDEERRVQLTLDVVNSLDFFNEAIAAPTGFFGRDVLGELNPFFNKAHTPEKLKQISENIKKIFSDSEWKTRFSKKQHEVQNLPHNRKRNSDAQKLAQNRIDVLAHKRELMLDKFRTNLEYRNNHKDGCNTQHFKDAQKLIRLGKKWIHSKSLSEQKYVKPDEISRYISNGWELGMLSRKTK